MLQQIEGSNAIAQAVSLCRPEVICAYPITPQTHIVEALSSFVREGKVGNCQFINAESEFGALSLLIGSSAAGARSYTATNSQGLLFMTEAVYNASGLGLPIVMTIGNRAVGAPINIWNDHSDSMALRDSGWIQMYVESNQEAIDVHIQAFRLAEQMSCPVMVCVDGFMLTHAYEPVDVPDQQTVDDYLPPYEPVQVLDPDEPMSIGAMVGPGAFTEVRYLAHQTQLQALERIPELSEEFERSFGREAGGLVQSYRIEDAETVVLALGSVNGTIRDAIDTLRDEGHAIGLLKVCTFRPFPLRTVREALEHVRRAVVVEKYLELGRGGVLSDDVRTALWGLPIPVHTVIAGLGGRAVTHDSLVETFRKAEGDDLDEPYFMDLDWNAVERELGRQEVRRRSGPVAENLLRDVNERFANLV